MTCNSHTELFRLDDCISGWFSAKSKSFSQQSMDRKRNKILLLTLELLPIDSYATAKQLLHSFHHPSMLQCAIIYFHHFTIYVGAYISSTTSHNDVLCIESLWTIRHYVMRPTILFQHSTKRITQGFKFYENLRTRFLQVTTVCWYFKISIFTKQKWGMIFLIWSSTFT